MFSKCHKEGSGHKSSTYEENAKGYGDQQSCLNLEDYFLIV